MNGVVSPYDLSERSHGAMAALMLCERCVTFLPVRAEEISEAGIERAAARSPRFGRLLDHWKWSMELWHDGVLSAAAGPSLDGARSLYEEVMAVRTRIEDEKGFAPLKPLVRAKGDEEFLEAASHDLMWGGGNPAVSVPVMAGLERFAAASGLWLFQSPASSIIGQLERRMGRALFSTTAPFPTGASGEAILTARELLETELNDLRSAMDESLAMVRAGATADDVRTFGREVIEPAATAYERAFAANADEFMWGEGGRRATVQLRLTCTQLPPETTLAAAAGAASVVRRGPASAGKGMGEQGIQGSSEGNGTAISALGAVALSVKALPWDVVGEAPQQRGEEAT